MWLYYLDEFLPVDCGGLPSVDCALAKAQELGCRAARVCRWGEVVEVVCAEGGAVKLLPTPQALYHYYQRQGEAICAEVN
ncbi:MAG: hypothetical protein QXT13_06410 [Pyrobaculum sp.]